MSIFFITPRFPFPLTKGDQLRAYNQVKYLSKHHEIVLFAITEEKIKPEWVEELKPFCRHIEIFTISPLDIFVAGLRRMTTSLPLQSIYHYNSKALKKLQSLYEEYTPGTMIFQLIRMAPYAAFFPREKCIIDLMDCFSYHYLLRGKHAGWKDRWFYNIEYRRVKSYEEQITKRYEKVVVISKKDKQLLPGNADHVHVVPNGVNFPPVSPGVEKTVDLLFLGNLSYQPNIAAALFISNEILPILNSSGTRPKVTIAGRDPVRKVTALASEQLEIAPNVNNIYELLGKAKVFVAPMFLSTGVQNKILEAMSAGLVVITTPNAADAIEATPGVHLITAISARDFAQHIKLVLESTPAFLPIISSARKFVEYNYDWEKNIKPLNKLIK